MCDAERLSLCQSPHHRRVIEGLLNCAIHGFLSNKTASLPEKLSLMHEIIQSGLSEEEEMTHIIESHDLMTIEEIQTNLEKRKRDTQFKSVKNCPSGCQLLVFRFRYLIVEFALSFLRLAVKNTSMHDEEMRSVVDKFVPLLVSCLHARQGNISSLALKSLCLIMPLPLPSLKEHATKAGSAVIRLLDAVSNMNDPIAQDCLKLLARILHAGASFQPTSMQVCLSKMHPAME